MNEGLAASPLQLKDGSSLVKPILALGIIWLGFSFVVVYFVEALQNRVLALAWIFLIWSLCLINLMILVRTIQGVFGMVTLANFPRQRVLFWGSLKLVSFGLLGFLLSQARTVSLSSLLLGMGTLVSVPLLSAYSFNKRIINHA